MPVQELKLSSFPEALYFLYFSRSSMIGITIADVEKVTGADS